jgi:peroxiredoxin
MLNEALATSRGVAASQQRSDVVGWIDPTAKQASFADQHNLRYPILSDADGAARKAYGVGKAFFGMAEGRETFFIDAKGIVRGVYVKNLGFQ